MKETKCLLCGSNLYEVVYNLAHPDKTVDEPYAYKITQSSLESSPGRIVRCRKCGFVYVNPREEAEKIAAAYKQMQDDLYVAEESGRRKAAKIILKKLSRFRTTGKILEIGCSTGFFLDEARRLKWDVYGVEMSKWAIDYCKGKLNLENIYEGTLEEAKLPYNFFDAIVMSDVIEHLYDPRQTLNEVRRILKPDGVLCISTPDIDSFLSRILKARWWGIQRAHLFYFSRKTLEEMLIASGFKAIKFRSHARVFSVDYWKKRLSDYDNPACRIIMSFLNILPKGHLVKLNLYDQIEVYAKKKRSLRYIDDDERREFGERKKMKSIVVLPAYNAARTLELTLKD
ncbi:MAG: class I SAM-dependent methyltransferase, partial [Candidatus Omnitrophica bacterium]|nr:class I SAM-dependent methyltransferase [Candidatus Omnitrophota bacterium]